MTAITLGELKHRNRDEKRRKEWERQDEAWNRLREPRRKGRKK